MAAQQTDAQIGQLYGVLMNLRNFDCFRHNAVNILIPFMKCFPRNPFFYAMPAVQAK